MCHQTCLCLALRYLRTLERTSAHFFMSGYSQAYPDFCDLSPVTSHHICITFFEERWQSRATVSSGTVEHTCQMTKSNGAGVVPITEPLDFV